MGRGLCTVEEPSRWPQNLRSAGGVYELRVGARQAEGGRKGAGAVGDQLGHEFRLARPPLCCRPRHRQSGVTKVPTGEVR